MTSIEVKVSVNPEHSIRQRYQQGELRLYKAVRAEHVKRKQARIKAERWKASKADAPTTAADMTVKCKTPDGNLVYPCCRT